MKLSDFGIARAEADASLTQTGLVTGSPAYLAPEVGVGRDRDGGQRRVVARAPPCSTRSPGGRRTRSARTCMGALYRIVHEEPPRLVDAGWLGPLLEATMTREPRTGGHVAGA